MRFECVKLFVILGEIYCVEELIACVIPMTGRGKPTTTQHYHCLIRKFKCQNIFKESDLIIPNRSVDKIHKLLQQFHVRESSDKLLKKKTRKQNYKIKNFKVPEKFSCEKNSRKKSN